MDAGTHGLQQGYYSQMGRLPFAFEVIIVLMQLLPLLLLLLLH